MIQPLFCKVMIILFCALPIIGNSQSDSIYLTNPSFEDFPRESGPNSPAPKGWYDCGRLNFPNQTPPDIHPVPNGNFRVTGKAIDGRTYLGLVVRYDETWESVSQRLATPLLKDKCYKFSIFLRKSDSYVSATRESNMIKKSFSETAVLRIWAANGYCGKKELLGESDPVANTDWIQYEFEFSPSGEYRFVVLEAFYKVPVLIPYGGHVLLDNASTIVAIPCDGEEVVPILAKADLQKKKLDAKPTPKASKEVVTNNVIEKVPEVKKQKLIAGLDRSLLKKGQILKIDNIYYNANQALLTSESYPVIDEIFAFLKDNNDIIVEVGGHTNGIPPHTFCDKLSNNRARSVAEYLIKKGISPKRLSFKGYGKRKRIASDRTESGRKKNQRVELKIISIG